MLTKRMLQEFLDKLPTEYDDAEVNADVGSLESNGVISSVTATERRDIDRVGEVLRMITIA